MAAAGLVRHLYHVINHHRVDEAVDLLDPDFCGHGMGSDRAGFRAELNAWITAFPDLSISIQRVVGENDTVAARIVLRGTQLGRFAGIAPTGRCIEIGGLDLLVQRDGRFLEGWGLRDLNALWVQLRMLPAVPIPVGTIPSGRRTGLSGRTGQA